MLEQRRAFDAPGAAAGGDPRARRRPSLDAVEVLAWAARVDDVPSLAEEAIDALRQIGATANHPLAQRAAVSALRDLAAEGTRRLEVIGGPRAAARVRRAGDCVRA